MTRAESRGLHTEYIAFPLSRLWQGIFISGFRAETGRGNMNFLEKYKEDFAEYDSMERDFIDDDKIWEQLNRHENPTREEVLAVLKKAETCTRLEPEEMAILIQNRDKELDEEMFRLARTLK